MERLNKKNINISYSGETSTNNTINNHIFIDKNGNITQIDKTGKDDRLKFYIDPTSFLEEFISDCVIGVSDNITPSCSGYTYECCTYGIGLGVGNDFIRAIYSE